MWSITSHQPGYTRMEGERTSLFEAIYLGVIACPTNTVFVTTADAEIGFQPNLEDLSLWGSLLNDPVCLLLSGWRASLPGWQPQVAWERVTWTGRRPGI